MSRPCRSLQPLPVCVWCSNFLTFVCIFLFISTPVCLLAHTPSPHSAHLLPYLFNAPLTYLIPLSIHMPPLLTHLVSCTFLLLTFHLFLTALHVEEKPLEWVQQKQEQEPQED